MKDSACENFKYSAHARVLIFVYAIFAKVHAENAKFAESDIFFPYRGLSPSTT